MAINDQQFKQVLDSIKDDNDQLIKIKRHLVDNVTLESLGQEYGQTKEGIRQTIVNYSRKILANLHTMTQELTQNVSKSKLVYLDELNFESNNFARLFIEILCYKNDIMYFEKELNYLYRSKEYSLTNILALITSNISQREQIIFSREELVEFMKEMFPDIAKIGKFIETLLQHKYINEVDEKYYFPFVYKTKKEMINFIFSITPKVFKIPKENDKLKKDLDIYFPNVFENSDVTRVITSAIENSRNIILWGTGQQIHKKHIKPILNTFNFNIILEYINNILEDTRIDLETTFEQFKNTLEISNIPNKYALHTLLKIKYPNNYQYLKAPWISKLEAQNEDLTNTLLSLMTEDRVYDVQELMDMLQQNRIRVTQLIDRIECIETISTNKFRNLKAKNVIIKIPELDQVLKNLIVLYNPYYNPNTIKDHLDILIQDGIVAFGKVLSKLRTFNHPNQERLDHIYDGISKHSPLQLFLTDYDSMYVANVIDVVYETKIEKPKYYENYEVEYWFIIDDMRLVVDKNFTEIRDTILTNFKTTGDYTSTYTLYGNSYVYPLEITMKMPINYFEKQDENYKFYNDIYRTKEQLKMKENIISFNYGEKRFYSLSPSTQENLINAELEYDLNKYTKQYDFSQVVMKYAKAVEQELWLYLRAIFETIINKDLNIGNYEYCINNRTYTLIDLLEKKATFGTYKFLLTKEQKIIDAINEYISLWKYI